MMGFRVKERSGYSGNGGKEGWREGGWMRGIKEGKERGG